MQSSSGKVVIYLRAYAPCSIFLWRKFGWIEMEIPTSERKEDLLKIDQGKSRNGFYLI